MVRFVTVDGEDFARKFFRGTKNGIKCEGTERKIQEFIKNSVIKYLSEIFYRKM